MHVWWRPAIRLSFKEEGSVILCSCENLPNKTQLWSIIDQENCTFLGEFGCLDVAAVRSGTSVLKGWNFRSCSSTLQQAPIPVAALLPSALQEFCRNAFAEKDQMDKYLAYWDLNWVLFFDFCLVLPALSWI